MAAQPTYVLASPDFDGSVLGGGVEQAIATPLHARHRLRVARQDFVTPAHHRVPDADTAILGGTCQVAALRVSGKKRPSNPFALQAQLRSYSISLRGFKSPKVSKIQRSLLA